MGSANQTAEPHKELWGATFPVVCERHKTIVRYYRLGNEYSNMKPTLFRILAASISLMLAVGISSIYSGIRAYRLKSTSMLTTSAALNGSVPAPDLISAESEETVVYS